MLIEFTELRHGLLNDSPTHPNAAHQRPVTMNLAILLAGRVAQVHGALSQPTITQKKIPKVVTTAKNPPPLALKYLIWLRPTQRKPRKPGSNCSSWARTRVLRCKRRQGGGQGDCTD